MGVGMLVLWSAAVCIVIGLLAMLIDRA